MAKKVVATLKKEGGVVYTKVVKMVKKNGAEAYSFEEKVMPKDLVNDFLKK
jgi:hypothetical protein